MPPPSLSAKTQFEVQAGKMSSTYQALKSLLYSGQGVGVLFHVGIKVAEVDAEL